MGKKKRKTKETRKDNFNKINTVFKNPINTDIVQELSRGPQRAIDLADNIDVPKQSINYHLNELKQVGIVQSNKIEVPMAGEIAVPLTKVVKDKGGLDDLRGLRVNGVDIDGNIKATWGVELTPNGKDIADNFVNRLYEEPPQENQKENKSKTKEKKEGN